MTYPFNSTQLAEIQTRLTAVENSTGTYTAIYEYIFDEISSSEAPATGVEPSVWLWVEGTWPVGQ